VQALNTMAVLNPGITHVAIDGAAFPDEAQQRGVMAVPTVFLNGQLFGQGRMELTQILDRLIGPATATQGANPAPYDMLIVGGGPAGCAAAVYAARKGIRTALVGERMGGQLLDTLGIENFMSTSRTEGPKLAAALEAQVREHAVDLYTARRATSLEPLTRDGLTDVRLDNGLVLSARTVVLATGARWRTMNVPGEEDYRNRGVAFCPHCDGPLFKDKRVAVIGGGNSGVEAAIDLAGIAREVTLFEFDGRLRADEILQRKLRSLGNVTVHLNAETTAVEGDGRRVTGLRWRDRQSGVDQRLALEGVFVQIGLAPNTQWLPASLSRNARGDIEVDERGATSMPGVYAAGDATTVPYKQIATAIGSGATAALAAFEYLMRTAPEATARAAA
jgi:NADH-dependent peroxiredoxin subunit F